MKKTTRTPLSWFVSSGKIWKVCWKGKKWLQSCGGCCLSQSFLVIYAKEWSVSGSSSLLNTSEPSVKMVWAFVPVWHDGFISFSEEPSKTLLWGHYWLLLLERAAALPGSHQWEAVNVNIFSLRCKGRHLSVQKVLFFSGFSSWGRISNHHACIKW